MHDRYDHITNWEPKDQVVDSHVHGKVPYWRWCDLEAERINRRGGGAVTVYDAKNNCCVARI